MPLKIDRTSTGFKFVSGTIVVFLLSTAVFLVAENWSKIPFQQLKPNYLLLAVSVIFSIINPFLSALFWKYIILLLNENAPLLLLWRINTYSQIVRYIPGKVWQYMGKIYWGKKIGLTKKTIIISTILETFFLLCSAFFISLYSISTFLPRPFILAIFAIILTATICLHPKILQWFFTFTINKWFKTDIVIAFSFTRILFGVFLYCIQWSTLGLQLFLFVKAFFPLSNSHFLYFTSINAGSWLVGFLSIIAPSGIGIKEGLMAFGLKTIYSLPVAIICAVLLRMFTIVTEFMITGSFFLLDKGAWSNFFDFRKEVSKESPL